MPPGPHRPTMTDEGGPTAPAHLGQFDTTPAGGRPTVRAGDLTGDGRMELLLAQGDDIDATRTPHLVTSLTAMTLEGDVVWQFGDVDADGGSHGADYPVQVWDVDGDGANEVACVVDDEFLVLEGATGEVQARHELPHPDAHDCIVPANLSGGDGPREVLLKDRYRRVWAMDENFDVLWTHRGTVGHYPWPADLDGDGRDEVVAGYDCLGPDGDVRWSMPIDDAHADCVWVADVDDDGEREVLVGEGGMYCYDADGTERWRNREPREVQHLAPGNFRPDAPALEVAGLDRIVRGSRGEPGQDGLFLVDSEGTTLAEEDREPGGWVTIAQPVTGWDDDRDLILAWRRGGGTNPGLYDGDLERVVRFPVDGHVVFGDLLGRGEPVFAVRERDGTAHLFAREEMSVEPTGDGPLAQPKRLATTTLYPGGELPADHPAGRE